MRSEFLQYFNTDCLLGPHGEDDILYTAQFAALSEDYTASMGQIAIDSLEHLHVNLFGPFFIDNFYPNPEDQTWSHDMHTGLVCLSRLRGFDYHNHWLWFDSWRRLQPWNVVFYLFAMNGFMHFIGLLLLPVLSLYMVLILAFPSKDVNGRFNASEPLIIWLMLQSVNMPVTKKISNLLVKRSKVASWTNYAWLYYGPGHPVYVLMKEQGL